VYISNITIDGFRNINHLDLSLDPKRNLIFGMNGVGKTSVLEAIFLLSFGKSFLTRKKNEMLNHSAEEFIIRLHSRKQDLVSSISSSFKSKLSLFLDDKKTSIFEINKYLYPVFFSSSDYNLYIESKPFSRKMIDRFIFGVDTLYIKHLLRYNNILKQKNSLLKSNRNKPELDSWNKVFCDLSLNLVGIKMKFVDRLNMEIKEKFGRNLRIGYKPSFDCPEQTLESFFSRLDSVKLSELKYQRSLIGPHLDSFDIFLDNEPLRVYSSGEKKINLLLIYIAFIEMFKKNNHEYPVFMLDDFDTAIDSRNIDYLVRSYPDMQVIATSVNRNTRFENLIELKKEN